VYPGDLVNIKPYEQFAILIEINVEYVIDVDLFHDFCKVLLSSGKIITVHKDFLELL
tara:strand:- start:71 stop:241 length:171 start_codon:yes stop_codon:yes gene_type:complete